MQKPIRYYITKSGEEPTVRSVRVALGPTEQRGEAEPKLADAEATVGKAVASPATTVKRRVKAAIRRSVDR